MCCDTVNRGVAYGDGKIFLHQADTTLVALDAKTGTGRCGRRRTAIRAKGRDRHVVADGVQGQGHHRHLGRRVRRSRSRDRLQPEGRQAGLARLFAWDPTATALIGSGRRPRHLGKPVGTDSSLNTWQGDQWKIGGGTTWGWYSYDPEAEPRCITARAIPRPGTRSSVRATTRWSMTIFARDADTGMAKWVYQMTPARRVGLRRRQRDDPRRSEDRRSKPYRRSSTSTATASATRWTATTGELLVAEKYDPDGQLDLRRRHGQSIADLRPPEGVSTKYSTERAARTSNMQGICPAALGTKDQQPAALSRRRRSCSTCRPTTSAWTMSRSR